MTEWSHRPEEAEELSRTREHKVKASGSEAAGDDEIDRRFGKRQLTGKEVLIMAVPCTAVRSTAAKIRPYLTKGQIVVDVAKGIEENTLMSFEPAD